LWLVGIERADRFTADGGEQVEKDFQIQSFVAEGELEISKEGVFGAIGCLELLDDLGPEVADLPAMYRGADGAYGPQRSGWETIAVDEACISHPVHREFSREGPLIL
jgi:hypothetical protein